MGNQPKITNRELITGDFRIWPTEPVNRIYIVPASDTRQGVNKQSYLKEKEINISGSSLNGCSQRYPVLINTSRVTCHIQAA